MNAALRAQQRYREDAILSATPERLVTMLYDRLLLDIDRRAGAQRAGGWTTGNTQLQHAQAVVAELMSSLTDGWDGTAGLRGLYAFLTQTLIGANVSRDPERTDAARAIVAPLREAWHAAAGSLASAVPAASAKA